MSNSAPSFTVCCCAAAPYGHARSDPAAAAIVLSMSLRFIGTPPCRTVSRTRAALVRVRPVFEVRARHPPPIGQPLRLKDQEDDDHEPKDDLPEGVQDR